MARVKLGEVARESKETVENALALPTVGLEHLTPGVLELERWENDAETTFSKGFKKDQILFGRRRAYLKKAVVAPFDGVCSGDITVIEAITNKIDKRLLPFVVQNDAFFDFAMSRSAGGLSPRVKWKDLKEYEFNLPPIEEQARIADLLWAMNDAKKAYRNLLAATDELVKARFVEMFGDPVENPKNWERFKLSSICNKLTDGTHFSPKSYPEGAYKYITAKNIKTNGLDFTSITYVAEDVHRDIYKRCNPEFGDILYIKDGVTTGIAMINSLKEEFSMLSSVALIKYNRNVLDGMFLHSLLNNESFYNSMRDNMGGAAITRLTVAKLSQALIIVPPLELQKRYAVFAENASLIRVTLLEALTQIENVLKSLLKHYFS